MEKLAHVRVLTVQRGVERRFFLNWLRTKVFGSHISQEITTLDAICGKFNSRRENILLTIMNEVQEGQTMKNTDMMKSVITDENIQIERKGINAYDAKDMNNHIAASNNHYICRPNNNDKMYVPIICSSKLIHNDEKYFEILAKALNKISALWFFNHLIHLNISKWNKRKIPDTKYRRSLILYPKKNSVLHFLINVIRKECIIDHVTVSKNCLYDKWKYWATENKVTNTLTTITFARKLSDMYGLEPSLEIPSKQFKHYEAIPGKTSMLSLSKNIINVIFQTKLKISNFNVDTDWKI